MGEYRIFWKRAFEFRGVASRREFWVPMGINILIILVLDFVSRTFLGWDISNYSLSDIWFFIILIPNISNGVRRLHDTNRPGAWYLLCLIPLAGFVVIAFWCMDTVYVDNMHRAYNREMGWDVVYPEKDGQYWKYYDESTFAGDIIATTGEEIYNERKDDMG